MSIKRGLTAIIGGGGKSSLLLKLGRELREKGNVILCSSTRIFPPEGVACLLTPGRERIADCLGKSNLICVGDPVEANKISLERTSVSMLLELADYVLCEADGSKHLPLKAHLEHEPVLPGETGRCILVVGVDGVGGRIIDKAHRPERYANILKKNIEALVTPQDVANVIEQEGYGDFVLINKVETDADREISREISQGLSRPSAMASIQEEWICAL
ncbi:putative selenium-dependent hydroxylase accessory protein YqeC [Christensenellaceae bacterium OttesenSCG-928-M15]|nr:putative selenium-dependent hydroxylase accessory protein YqeC [Christensenellaceae bacterium OttesenSCG-928-M15]